MDEQAFLKLVQKEARSSDPILIRLATALYRDDPAVTPRTSHTPYDAHLREMARYFREEKSLDQHFKGMALRLSELWADFRNGSPSFWHRIFDDGREQSKSYRACLPTRMALSGGYIDGLDNKYYGDIDPAPPYPTSFPPSEHDTFRAAHIDLKLPDFDNYNKWVSYDDNSKDHQRDLKEYERTQTEIQRDHDKQRSEYDRAIAKYDAWQKRADASEPLTRAKERLQKLSSRFSGDALMREFFKATPLELLYPEPEVNVEITSELAFSGTWVLAAQGYGKTTLLSKLILDRMNEPCSIIVFDSKPELSTFFRDRKFPKDVVVIDPDPFLALNPLDLGTHNVDILMYLFAALLDAKFTPLQSVALRQAVYLTSLIPNATFATFTDIINNGAKKYPDVVAALDDEERTFWERDYDSGTYRDTRAQIIWRLNLLRPPGSRTRTMFNAPKTKVRLPPLMDGNTLTIINNSIPELGGLQSEFFSRLFLVLILGAAEQRALLPESKKRPCYIFMDEAHTVIANEPNISDIIYRTRSQKIALLCAHQSLSQIKNEQVTSALSDCAIRYANCDNDAPSMATHLGTTADHLRGLGVGQFALAVRGSPTAQTIKVPLPDFSPYPKLSAADIEARQARFREQYCYTPAAKPDVPVQSAPVVPSTGEWGGKPVV